ncbi:MAG TPA: Gfo/Idh/MocA family oxidoreductase [Methylomirabilota bacterium]|nr:Gfo/Idh/MocA family oxidoreductase [Methylomirabilota bacterium]
MLRGAIIGLGNVALDGHLPGWLAGERARIVAVTDVDGARRAEAASRLSQARWFDSADDLLQQAGLDFVDICTPPSSHAPLIERALRRGLHVLCEKPLVRSLDELAPLTRLAAARGRVLHTVHNWHHAPGVKVTAELLAAGAIGPVSRVVWQTLRARPAATRDAAGHNWRLDPTIAGGGILTDHGWHVFYVVQRWIGARPLTVAARLETRRHTTLAVEDTATVTLTFPQASAEILLTWAADERRNWAQVSGAGGTLELQDDTLVLTRDGRTERRPCPPALSSGSVHPDWFAPVAAAFLADVARGRDGANLAEASLCVALESLARESSRRGGEPLPVPPEAGR